MNVPERDRHDDLLDFARRAHGRAVLADRLRVLGATALPYFGAALLVLVTCVLVATTKTVLLSASLVCLGAWIAHAIVRTGRSRPSIAAAVARFDQASDNGELFLSALSLTDSATPGARLHLARAGSALDAARNALPRALPLRLPPVVFATPLLFLAALLLWPAARTQAPSAATDPVREQVRESTPIRPAQPAPEVASAPAAPSPSLLRELSKHPDTARLAAALRTEDAERKAAEVDRLARRLASSGLTDEARHRIEKALDRSLAAADEPDRSSAFARSADAARRALASGRPSAASEALASLARDLREGAGRLRRRKAMDDIAAALDSNEAALIATFGSGARARAGVTRVGEGSAPYERKDDLILEPGRDEVVAAGGATPAPRDSSRPDSFRPAAHARGAGTPALVPLPQSTVRFGPGPERAVPNAQTPASLRDLVEGYFDSLRTRAAPSRGR